MIALVPNDNSAQSLARAVGRLIATTFSHSQHTLCDLINWELHSALSADQASTAWSLAYRHHANAFGHCRSNGDVSADAARDCVGLDGAVAFHGPHVPSHELLSRVRTVLVQLCHGLHIARQVS